jgi:hypothetical protein
MDHPHDGRLTSATSTRESSCESQNDVGSGRDQAARTAGNPAVEGAKYSHVEKRSDQAAAEARTCAADQTDTYGSDMQLCYLTQFETDATRQVVTSIARNQVVENGAVLDQAERSVSERTEREQQIDAMPRSLDAERRP